MESFFSKELEGTSETVSEKELSEGIGAVFELDFVEEYEDADGILHIKTAFAHDDLPESDVWEVIEHKDSSELLDLLKYIDT